MKHRASLGAVIDRRRREAGVSIRWLARHAEMNHTTMWRTLHSERDVDITLDELTRIAGALDLAASDLADEVA